MAVSTGVDLCVLCDYPGVENEMWSTSCAVDEDGMCGCNITDTSPGVQLCFTNFHSGCSRQYECSAQVNGAMCSEQAEFVATSKSLKIKKISCIKC